MTTLIAKPIKNDTSWVITDGNSKVGNVIADTNGFDVKLNGIQLRCATAEEIKQKTQIEFDNFRVPSTKINRPYPNLPTPDVIYNSVIDVKNKLHLFTKEENSKSFFAAGWFVIGAESETPEIVFCPKYIFIQRYKYYGPFETEQDARDVIK